MSSTVSLESSIHVTMPAVRGVRRLASGISDVANMLLHTLTKAHFHRYTSTYRMRVSPNTRQCSPCVYKILLRPLVTCPQVDEKDDTRASCSAILVF